MYSRNERPPNGSGPHLFLFEQCVYKLEMIERCKVVDFFPGSNKPDGNLQFVVHGERYSALRGSVQFGKYDAVRVHGLKKALCLEDCVLPSGRVEHEQGNDSRLGTRLLCHALDFLQLFHEIELRV